MFFKLCGRLKINMKMKTKFYWLVLLIGFGLIVYSLFFKNFGEFKNTDLNTEDAGEEQTVHELNISMNTLDGILMASDNFDRGNFKLVSKTSEIYIRTARDFSDFIGLEVVVFISGTLERFELIDIQPRIEKDGYIKEKATY